ncbi:MAG: membrane dipeptidase [Gemmatimonadota bacterium]
MTTAPAHDVAARARELLRTTLPCEMVFIYLPEDANDVRLFPRYVAVGYAFVSVHPAGDGHNIGEAIRRIARCRADILGSPSEYLLVETVADITRARREGRLGVGMHLEGFRCLERDLNMVEVYYRLGVRFCHPIFNQINSIGGGCADRMDIGLTRFGLQVIAEMNRVGMIVDGAHAGYRSTMDMLEHSAHPVMLSHHGCDALHPHFRNLKDDQMKRCGERGGVVGISGAGFYLGGEPTPALFFKHVDYAVQLIGAEHVALGTDYLATPEVLAGHIKARPNEWPGLAEGKWEPLRFMPPEMVPEVVELMLRNGYSDDAVKGILGENFLRVCRQVWK